MTAGASVDAVELLTTDHRAVERLFRHLLAAGQVAAVENQRDLAQRIVRELSVHAAVEEQVLYPAARELLPDGDRWADESLHAHGEVKHLLGELDGLDPVDDGFESCVTRLMELVRSHVGEEEAELLPALHRLAGRERLQELGTAMEQAKEGAPTRPHPHAPERPPVHIVAGAVATVADRAGHPVRPLVRGPQS
ncbi:MAG TPA: hemerythrin domain-containing protein [Acidimicrobiales bacterium]|nr:hemerythrin domain-containing protein [Acidimicrobiales bacterium]